MDKPDTKWYPENLDWYVKWAATAFIIVAVMFRQAGPEYRVYDLVVGFVGTGLWAWVSVMWGDRALIILNAVMMVMLGSAILREFI
tara:strand:+ start:1283 stop:1540 length:258 start_codon:yes stop_codon:yes gene_type:complete